MTLIHQPGNWHQMALAALDAGITRDIALMLADVHAVLAGLAEGEAPAAARQAAALLDDADSPYLQGLADAVSEAEGHLHRACDAALAEIPDIP